MILPVINRNVITLIVLICAFLLTSCALWKTGTPRPEIWKVNQIESWCESIKCYRANLGKYPPQEEIDADGNLKWTWRSTVTKTRPLRDGETPTDKRHYRYKSQSCWFTVTFNPDGEVIETEWHGPGCF